MSIMATLAAIVATASSAAGIPCATIDNVSNTASFSVPGRGLVVATYRDYGDNLGYSLPIPREAWAATRKAQRKIRRGKPGAKRVTACSRPAKRDLR